MKQPNRVLTTLADEFLQHERNPTVVALAQFSSFLMAYRKRTFFTDNEITWEDLRKALDGKVAYTDKMADGLVFPE